jgi:hypothetical protein
MLAAAEAGLSRYARQGEPRGPASTRLAFRELGLAIGLQAVERMWNAVERQTAGSRAGPEAREHLEGLRSHDRLRARIESFWLEPANQRARTWTEHRDINEVMLATSLAPEGCLVLPPVDGLTPASPGPSASSAGTPR